jgi:hypothetical protein
VTIKIPPENIFDKILKLFGKRRGIEIPKSIAQVQKESEPYVTIKAKKKSFWKALFGKK